MTYAAGLLHEAAAAAAPPASAAAVGCIASAAAQYAAAIELFPCHAPSHVRLGMLAVAQAQAQIAAGVSTAAAVDVGLTLERGLAHARAALRADPRDAAAWQALSALAGASGRAAAAVDASLKAAAAADRSSNALLQPSLLPWRVLLW